MHRLKGLIAAALSVATVSAMGLASPASAADSNQMPSRPGGCNSYNKKACANYDRAAKWRDNLTTQNLEDRAHATYAFWAMINATAAGGNEVQFLTVAQYARQPTGECAKAIYVNTREGIARIYNKDAEAMSHERWVRPLLDAAHGMTTGNTAARAGAIVQAATKGSAAKRKAAGAAAQKAVKDLTSNPYQGVLDAGLRNAKAHGYRSVILNEYQDIRAACHL